MCMCKLVFIGLNVKLLCRNIVILDIFPDRCKCQDGYIGNGNICFGNIIQRLQELNTDPKSRSYGQLSSAISLFGEGSDNCRMSRYI